MASARSLIKTYLLGELLEGLWVTWKKPLAKEGHRELPGGKDAPEHPLSRAACAAPISERRGTLHRVQALRGGVSGAAITIESGVANDGTRRTTRYDIDLFKCIYCGFCEEACPVDAIVETRLHEYHMENRGENIMNKDKLLAVGERYEAMIAADRAADARYR